jgi:hypothetical protein
LALTVLYESALQHLADRPESFLAQPQQVKDFLSDLPSVWDETKLLGGYPGEYAAMARRSGDTWYVAVINGSDEPRSVTLDWSRMKTKAKSGKVFADSGNADSPWSISADAALPSKVDMQPRGGFVMVIPAK